MRRVRELALALPETTEEPHHEIGSFRVRGKIFATLPDDQHLRVMLPEQEATAVCAAAPGTCVPLYWGSKLRGVVISIRAAPAALIAELLTEAWHVKATPALRRSLPTA